MEIDYFMKVSARLQGFALVCVGVLAAVCFYKYLEIKVVMRNSPVGKLYGEGRVIKPGDTALTVMLGDKLADYVYMLKAGIFSSLMLSFLSLVINILGLIKRYPGMVEHGVFFVVNVFTFLIFLMNYVIIKLRTDRLSEEFFDRHRMRDLVDAALTSALEDDPEDAERIKNMAAETAVSHRKFLSTLVFGGILAAVLAVAVSLLIVAVLMMTRF